MSARNNSVFALALILLVVLAGCLAADTPAPAPTTSSTPGPSATTSPASSPIESPRGPQSGSEWTVTITRVIDGDTMEAEFPNGETDTIRLLGVDTPETTLNRVNPAEFKGIPDSTAGRDHLFNWGERATAFATDELADKHVRIAVDPDADRRGGFGRLLVYIYVDGVNFNLRLLEDGYARLYDSAFSQRDTFQQAEESARNNNRGLWDFTASTPTPTPSSTGSGALAITRIHEDATGNDHEILNDEYVVFENTGSERLDLSGWTVHDEADHTYDFPVAFTLAPGAAVTLFTGDGTDTETELYWGSSRAIWNNDGDTGMVTDDSGSVVIEYEYP